MTLNLPYLTWNAGNVRSLTHLIDEEEKNPRIHLSTSILYSFCLLSMFLSFKCLTKVVACPGSFLQCFLSWAAFPAENRQPRMGSRLACSGRRNQDFSSEFWYLYWNGFHFPLLCINLCVKCDFTPTSCFSVLHFCRVMEIIKPCWLKALRSWGNNSALVSKCVLVVCVEPGSHWKQIR